MLDSNENKSLKTTTNVMTSFQAEVSGIFDVSNEITDYNLTKKIETYTLIMAV